MHNPFEWQGDYDFKSAIHLIGCINGVADARQNFKGLLDKINGEDMTASELMTSVLETIQDVGGVQISVIRTLACVLPMLIKKEVMETALKATPLSETAQDFVAELIAEQIPEEQKH